MRNSQLQRLMAGACAGMSIPAAAQSFANGDFQSGLTGWTVVNTSNGLGSPGSTQSVDIDGPGPLAPSFAATFSVGQVVHQVGVPAGVDMIQRLFLVAGSEYVVDFDWSAQVSSGTGNLDGGRFALIVGGSIVTEAQAQTTTPAAPRYGHVTGSFTPTASGPIDVGVRISRGFTPAPTLSQYVDHVTISPPSTPLGALPSGLTTASGTLGINQVLWYKFTISDIVAPAYLDIDTEGSALTLFNDTELGLYSATGDLIATDDDSGSGLLSQLTFGDTVPRAAVGEGAPYDGRNGNLSAGTYYLAVAGFNSAFAATNWGVESASTNTGPFQVRLARGVTVAGACCAPAGSCSITTQGACVSVGGVYRGDGSDCAGANCPQPYHESGDAGQTPATAQVVTGSGALAGITGVLSTGNDVDLYQIEICDHASFSATTVGTTSYDTQLALFTPLGMGVTFDDDSPQGTTQSTLTGQFVATNGTYLLAISAFDSDPVDAASAELWLDSPFNVERRPDGPGAANPFDHYDNNGSSSSGPYTIVLRGTCYPAAAPCYANCDNSTIPPVLNVLDFACFLNRFAANDSYANCDSSTTPPVLNVLDFACFLNRFAAGCS